MSLMLYSNTSEFLEIVIAMATLRSRSRSRGATIKRNRATKSKLPSPEPAKKQRLSKIKTKLRTPTPSKSYVRAGLAYDEFEISPFWRLYSLFAATVGIMGHLGSLVGLFGDSPVLLLWYETDSHFVYSQITFVTSSIYIINATNLVWNRPAGSLPRILIVYPVVTFAYFTIFTGGALLGFTHNVYINHFWNQVIHVIMMLFCPGLRRYILDSGLRLILKDVTFFGCTYWVWIWQCFFSLGKWPYDFLDLRTGVGNGIFFGVVVGMYVVTCTCYWLCKRWEAYSTRDK